MRGIKSDQEDMEHDRSLGAAVRLFGRRPLASLLLAALCALCGWLSISGLIPLSTALVNAGFKARGVAVIGWALALFIVVLTGIGWWRRRRGLDRE